MTVTQEFVAYCEQLNAKGEKCDYVARSNQSAEDVDKMVKAHQLARPVAGETDLRPAREIEQHYPHFVGYDKPNVGGSAAPSASASSAGEQALTPPSPPEPPVTTNVDVETHQHPGTTESPGGQS